MIWYDDIMIKNPSHSLFSKEYWDSYEKIVGRTIGRGTTWFIKLSKTQAVLRHYNRGGLVGKLIKDLYFFSSWEKTRVYQELQLLKKLTNLGLNVPRPFAARVIKRGFFLYQADLLCERIVDAKNLGQILKHKPITENVYQNIGAEIAKLHNEQVNHSDLNIYNILLDDKGEIWLIDFDKCNIKSKNKNNNWKKNNLSRLKRSFIKETNKSNIYWRKEDFLSIMKGYNNTYNCNKFF
ncbi:3-deoxy-D-manno-octulosonic acid kinase [Candidatus Photodesmus anomalopis]|uniref:3-deoxy-D-manno-octulosonic acid kinase n=1 Tax=Candidatus Photodesmus anomalopis TaxID=28176 RepID=UPI000590CED1